MTLNPDLYYDVAWEFLNIKSVKPRTQNQLLLSGNMPLLAFKTIVSNAKSITIY